MEKELSAAPRGTEKVSPPKSRHGDDLYRRYAVEELALHLTRGGALLQRCEELADVEYGDRLGPIHAAARLINANAQLARALAQVAQAERRTRTIVETIQKPDPNFAGLNSTCAPALKAEEFRAVLEGGLRLLLSVPQQKQQQPDTPAIEYSI